MSSYLCFICHSTVNEEINEDTREKYRDVVGMNLCPDSQLCYICCHVLNKLFLFRSVCLKRSLEYPVLFSEKGTLNLQKGSLEIHVLCPEDCNDYEQNTKTYDFTYNNDETRFNDNEYVKLEDDNEFNDNFNTTQYINNTNINNDYDFDTNQQENIINDNENNDEVNLNDDTVGNENDTDIINDNCDNDIDTSNEIEGNITENNDINDTTVNQNNESNVVIEKKVKKSNRTKKKCFKKILLSVEEQRAALEANRREEKYTEAEFKCYNCGMGFLFKDTYQTHMMRHEESNGEYQCSICTLRFASATLLRIHTASHSERYICAKCGASLKPRAKRSHMCVRKNVQSVACQFCGNLFKDASGLQQHLRRVHASKAGSRLLSCVVCGESYKSQATLRTHMIKHIQRKFHCDQCPSVYSSPYTLAQHRRTHESGGQLHYCSTCQVGYATRKSLLAHKRNSVNHQQSLLECPVCRRPCPTRRSLGAHVQAVHAGREHGCPLCPARYTSRKALARHAGAHGDKPGGTLAMCHVCGSSFKGNNKLNRHLREVCEKTKLEEEISSLYY